MKKNYFMLVCIKCKTPLESCESGAWCPSCRSIVYDVDNAVGDEVETAVVSLFLSPQDVHYNGNHLPSLNFEEICGGRMG